MSLWCSKFCPLMTGIAFAKDHKSNLGLSPIGCRCWGHGLAKWLFAGKMPSTTLQPPASRSTQPTARLHFPVGHSFSEWPLNGSGLNRVGPRAVFTRCVISSARAQIFPCTPTPFLLLMSWPKKPEDSSEGNVSCEACNYCL
jgi:hypothetical protein